MRAITTTLYVCGGLMAVAAVMGTIDYNAAQRKGVFNKLYKEEKPAASAMVADKEIELEDYSRGEINPVEAAPVKLLNTAPVKKEKAAVAKQARKKKKTISYSKFSRAAIVDELILIDSTVKLK